jgi:hypothetical protein
MKYYIWISMIAMILCVGTGCENGDIEADGGQDVSVQNGADADPTPVEDLTIDDILAKMEAAGEQYPAIAATIDYTVDQKMTGDSEKRTGAIKYDAGSDESPPRFYVGFETLQLGDGPTLADRVEYGFDGYWLTIAKHRIKQMTKYEVVREGEQADVFKLGRGPFPVPFGQSTETIREFFDVTNPDAPEGSPENTLFLSMKPKEEKADELNYAYLWMWVDTETFLPVKIRSRDANRDETTVVFDDIDTDYEPRDSDFDLPGPPLGWQFTREALDE